MRRKAEGCGLKVKGDEELSMVSLEFGVLNSPRAVQVNVEIMRTFVRLRKMLSSNKELAHKLAEHERKIERHDGEIKVIFDAIRGLMTPPEPKKKKIGF
ncbi:MAG: hypothetical protein Q7T53_09130 [Deltaproteobacteria bacterium]|nr:hypothetical protein [Deltaproteobacteria bacterium]